MPVMALFFPVDVAVSLTAIVHLLNNLLKLMMFARHAVRRVLIPFAATAIPSALLGSWLLIWLSGQEPLFTYQMFGAEPSVTLLNAVLACLMIVFALVEVLPRLRNLSFSPRLVPVGGILSGFFGGLSGHQGALRSAFLVRAGLSKEQFIGTGVVIACLVDIARLILYESRIGTMAAEELRLLVVAAGSAFLGTALGARFLRRVTLGGIQAMVSLLLFSIAVALGAGLI